MCAVFKHEYVCTQSWHRCEELAYSKGDGVPINTPDKTVLSVWLAECWPSESFAERWISEFRVKEG